VDERRPRSALGSPGWRNVLRCRRPRRSRRAPPGPHRRAAGREGCLRRH